MKFWNPVFARLSGNTQDGLAKNRDPIPGSNVVLSQNLIMSDLKIQLDLFLVHQLEKGRDFRAKTI
jgi:hypothetical protein